MLEVDDLHDKILIFGTYQFLFSVNFIIKMSNPAKGSFTLKFEVKVTIAESGSSLANPVASNGDEPSTSGAISNRHANGYRSHDFQIVNRNSEVFGKCFEQKAKPNE